MSNGIILCILEIHELLNYMYMSLSQKVLNHLYLETLIGIASRQLSSLIDLTAPSLINELSQNWFSQVKIKSIQPTWLITASSNLPELDLSGECEQSYMYHHYTGPHRVTR